MEKKRGYLLDILRSEKTVFSTDDVSLLWKETNRPKVQDRARYYLKNKQLYSIKKGFYAKDENYNRLEFAIKLHKPSYISFETVLAREGIINQYHESIFVASYLSKEISVDNQNYIYKKIKDSVLSNPEGIEQKANVWVASKERAFVDTVYLYQDYYFDNLLGIGWDLVFKLAPIYQNKTLIKRLKEYQSNYA